MSLILAIEPDRRQAAQLAKVVGGIGADLILVDTTERALDAIGTKVPDLVLVPALLSPSDDAALAAALRVIAAAARVQMLTTPVFGGESKSAPAKKSGLLKALRRERTRASQSTGCDPKVFAEQIVSYLDQIAQERAAAAEIEIENDAPPVEEVVHAVEPEEQAFVESFEEEPFALDELSEEGIVESLALVEAILPAVDEPEVVKDEPPIAEDPDLILALSSETFDPLEPDVSASAITAEAPMPGAPEIEAHPVDEPAVDEPQVVVPEMVAALAEPPDVFERELLDADILVPDALDSNVLAFEPTIDVRDIAFDDVILDEVVLDQLAVDDMALDPPAPEPEPVAMPEAVPTPEPVLAVDAVKTIDVTPAESIEFVIVDDQPEPQVGVEQIDVPPDELWMPLQFNAAPAWPGIEGVPASRVQARPKAPAPAPSSLSDDLAAFLATADEPAKKPAPAPAVPAAAAPARTAPSRPAPKPSPSKAAPLKAVPPKAAASKVVSSKATRPARAAAPVPAPPKAAKPDHEWVELIESLRHDVERLRAERRQPPEPTLPPAQPRPVSRRERKARAAQDEWGFFDPEQCGFAALLAKLDEVTDIEDGRSS